MVADAHSPAPRQLGWVDAPDFIRDSLACRHNIRSRTTHLHSTARLTQPDESWANLGFLGSNQQLKLFFHRGVEQLKRAPAPTLVETPSEPRWGSSVLGQRIVALRCFFNDAGVGGVCCRS